MLPFIRTGFLFGLAAMSAVPPALLAGETLDAKAGWALLKQCAAQADDAARHGCTDAVLRRAGLLAGTRDATPPSHTPMATGSPAPAPAPAGQPPAWYAAAAPFTARSAAAAREPDRIEVTLSSVQNTADGKLLLTTSDGAVWKQTESQTLSAVPQQGQAMTIKRKSLGSFMCEPGRYVSFRCYRVR